MRVLACGDRDWSDRTTLYAILDELNAPTEPITVLIEGEARGADLMARRWAEDRGITVEPYPAKWQEHGRAAGPIRNTEMLVKGQPDFVVAFHDDLPRSKGTANMVRQARRQGLGVYIIGLRTRHYMEPKPDLQSD